MPDKPHPNKGKKAGRAKVLFSSAPSAPKPEGPKIMFGAKPRTRLPCTLADLRALDKTASDAQLDRALQVVATVNLDDMYFEDVVKFAARLQAAHGAISEQELALTKSQTLPEAQALHRDIITLFEKLEPDAVFGFSDSWLRRALRKVWPFFASPEAVFNSHYPRLLARAKALERLEPRLAALHKTTLDIATRYAALGTEISAYILAVNFIAQYVYGDTLPAAKRALYLSHITALEERRESLRITQTTVETGALHNQLQQKNLERLMAAGRRLVAASLPALQTAYSIAISAMRGKTPAPDWRQSLRNIYDDITETITEKGD